MRAIIAEMAEAVRHGSSASSIEEICRFAVAQAMEDEDRLLFDEEIADIVEPTVKDETMTDPAAIIDGDQAILNENEWNSLDEESKAVDKEGRLYVISGGRLYEAEITKDPSAARIASAISFDIEAALTAKSIQDGCTYDLASFHLNAEEVERACPLCGSHNTSVVWYDKQVVVNHCHDCEEDFETQMDPDTATAEELTTEEFELSDGNSAFTWYDEEGWHLEIDEPDGTLVHMFDISDPDEAESLMDEYESGEFDVEEGEVLKSVESGNELIVSAIDGRFAEINGKRAPLSNLKVSKMLGRFISDKSAVRELIARSGDAYVNDYGDRLVIESAENGVIVYNEVSINKLSGLTQDITARCSKSEFIDVLENGGYAYKSAESFEDYLRNQGIGPSKMAGELSDRFYQQYGHRLRRQTEERLQWQGGTDEVLEQYYHEQYGGGSGESQKSNNDGESGKSDKSDNEQSGNSHSEQEVKDRAESLEIGKFKNLEDRYSAETSDGKYDISALVKNIDDVWDNGATPIYEPYISDANGKEIVVTEDEFESLEECEWAAMDLYEQMLNGELPSGEDSEDTHISDDERVISLENELGVRFTDPWDDGEEMFTEPIDGLWSLDVLRKTDGTFMASVISDRSGKSWNDKRTFDNSDDAMVAAMELYKNNEDMFKKMKKKWEDYDAKRS